MGRQKFCIWCEVGNEPVGDYLWIHKKCFFDLEDIAGNVESVTKQLEEHKGITEITDFLKSMADFKRKWENTTKLIAELRKGEVSEEV